MPRVEGTPGEVHISRDLNRLLNVTDKLAQQRNDQFISSELFLLAAVDDKEPWARSCARPGRTKAALEQTVDQLRGGQQVDNADAEDQRQALERYTIDLTERPSRASSTRSSGATTRFGGRSRCCSGGPRTTPS